jgi:hypothetical protein
MASFLVQMVKFICKRSNFNLNGPIMNRHTTTARRPQRQMVVRTVPSDPTPAQMILPGLNKCQPHHPITLPHRPGRNDAITHH